MTAVTNICEIILRFEKSATKEIRVRGGEGGGSEHSKAGNAVKQGNLGGHQSRQIFINHNDGSYQ